jgi:hypothetical protein
MKLYLTLYIHEWRENKNLFLFVLMVNLGLVCLGAYYYAPDDMMKMVPALIPFFFALIICVVAPPFILSRSFANERRSHTLYLRFALPVSLSASSLCKYLAITSMGCVLYGVVFSGLYLMDSQLMSMGELRVNVLPLFLGYLIFWLSIAFVMSALKVTLKRFHGLVSGLFFMVSLILFFRLKIEMTMMFTEQNPFTDGWLPAVYGLVLLGIGLLLFEKRAEVG